MITLKRYIETHPPMDEEQILGLIESLTKQIDREFDADDSKPRLTPMNIILDDQGHFSHIDQINGLANSHYIAPEEIDSRTNRFPGWIYNIGAIFYYVASGKDPYGHYNPENPADNHLNRKLPWPTELRPDLQTAVGAMIMKMMLPLPGKRHQSMKTFELDMDNLRQGEWPLNAPIPINASQTVNNGIPAQSSNLENNISHSKKKKRVAVSNRQINSARKRSRSKRRKVSRGEFVYLLLIAAIIWGAWHYYFEDLWLEHQSQLQNEVYETEGEIDRTSQAESEVYSAANGSDSYRQANRSQGRSTSNTRDYDDHYSEYSDADTETNSSNSEESEYRQSDNNISHESSRSTTRQPEKKKVWNNAQFIRGAKLYNRAVKLYKAYAEQARKGRTNSRILDRIETYAQQAAKYFRACQHLAPSHIPIQDYLDNCYQLIADCRQSKLLDMAE